MLFDLRFSVYSYTWDYTWDDGRIGSSFIEERLDCALASVS